jgi:hypothetical protein
MGDPFSLFSPEQNIDKPDDQAVNVDAIVRQFLLFDFYIAHFSPKIDNDV